MFYRVTVKHEFSHAFCNWTGHRQGTCFKSTTKIVESDVYPACIYLLKVSNKNNKKMRKTCSKLTIKAPWWHQWRRFDVLIVNFEQIYHIVLVFSLLTLNMWMRLTSYWNRWYLLLTLSKFVCIASLSLLPSLFFFSIGSLEGLCFNVFGVNCQFSGVI